MFGKKQLATIVAEFLGTGFLALAYISVERSSIGVPFFIALAAGGAIIAVSFMFGSKVQLNPVLTFAGVIIRKIDPIMGAINIVAQLLGAWAAYGAYHVFIHAGIPQITSLHFKGEYLFAEAVGAFLLALAWGAANYRKIESTAKSFILGGSYILAVIIASASAGIGIINPAVALTIRAWNIWGSLGWGNFVAGPFIGATIGIIVYELVFKNVINLQSETDVNTNVTNETFVFEETVVNSPSSKSTARSSVKSKSTTATKSTSKSKKKPAKRTKR